MSHTFYAICDTDGGRHEPKPLAAHIYTTEEAAKRSAEYRGYDPRYYTVLPVSVEVIVEVIG